MIFHRPLKIHRIRHLWISLCSISVLRSNGNLRSISNSKVEWRLVLCQPKLSNSNTNLGVVGKALAEMAKVCNQCRALLWIMCLSPTQTPERPECTTGVSLGKSFRHPAAHSAAGPARDLRCGVPSQTPLWHNHTASSLERNLFLSVAEHWLYNLQTLLVRDKIKVMNQRISTFNTNTEVG